MVPRRSIVSNMAWEVEYTDQRRFVAALGGHLEVTAVFPPESQKQEIA